MTETAPSVSSILDVYPRPGLNEWIVAAVVDEAVDRVGQLYSMAKKDTDAARRWLANARHRKAQTAAVTGSQIHAMLRKIKDTERPTARERGHYLQVVEWMQQRRATIIDVAVAVAYSDPPYGWQGEADMMVEHSDATWVVEVKTGRRIWPADHIQAAMYAAAVTSQTGRDVACSVLRVGADDIEEQIVDVDQGVASARCLVDVGRHAGLLR